MDGNKLTFSLLRKFHLLLFLLSSEVSLRLTSLSTSIWIVKNQRAAIPDTYHFHTIFFFYPMNI